MAAMLRRLAFMVPVGVPVGLYSFAKLNPEKATVYYKPGFEWLCAKIKQFHHKQLSGLKEELFSGLQKPKEGNSLQVLEIGAGAGANFKYFPPGTSVIAVDRNPHIERCLRENSKQYPDVQVTKFVVAGAENMADVAEGSVDAVVCTLVLCTVQDVDAVLKEVKRVLKPGGKFYYFEHSRHPTHTRVQYFQEMFNPVFYTLGNRCNINRETWKNIDNAGFSDVKYKMVDNMRPKFLCHILYGTATK